MCSQFFIELNANTYLKCMPVTVVHLILLSVSFQFVGEKPTKSFRKLMQITDPTNNHINYRKVLSSVHRRVGEQCIPYFGKKLVDIHVYVYV